MCSNLSTCQLLMRVTASKAARTSFFPTTYSISSVSCSLPSVSHVVSIRMHSGPRPILSSDQNNSTCYCGREATAFIVPLRHFTLSCRQRPANMLGNLMSVSLLEPTIWSFQLHVLCYPMFVTRDGGRVEDWLGEFRALAQLSLH